jgi:hypothetical protein
VVDHGSRSVEIYNELKELGRAERLRNSKRDDIYGEIAQYLYHLAEERIMKEVIESAVGGCGSVKAETVVSEKASDRTG